MQSSRQEFDAGLLLQAQELVHVGTWSWDVASNTVRWSDELFRLFGLDPQSIPLALETYLSFVHPDDREWVAALVGASLENRRDFQFDARIVTASGDVRYHYARGGIVCDERGEVAQMIGACLDVSDRVQEQEALRVSEERFRLIFEQSAVGLALTEARAQFVSVNPSFEKLLGYSSEELLKLTIFDITHPDDRENTLAMKELNDGQRPPYTYEKRYVRKSGEIVWARVTGTRLRLPDGTPDGYMGVIEDVTERWEANEALNRERVLLQTIMEHMPVMVSLFQGDGKPIYVNREWERVMGWTLKEAQEIDLFSAAYPDPALARRARDAVRKGRQGWVDLEPKARDGRVIPSSWSCISLNDGTSLTIGQDMTERRQLQQRLGQSQKLEALGQLAGGVAHDFNNLLTIISASATFVMEAIEPDGEAAGDVREIIAATNRAASLTRQLLAFSRRQMLKPEIVNVNATVQSLAKTLSRLLGEDVQLAVVPVATSATVEVDINQLEQVVLNLAVNARDAVSGKGTVTIETSNVRLPVTGAGFADYVAISVIDDGCGIPADVREHMFEPFYTTKAVGKGTGLGLATVQGIVDQSGGRLEVESEVGRGSTFRVMLPVAAPRPVPMDDTAAAEDMRGQETVLLVEDEAAVRAVARRVLIGLGYTVLEARHGADAARLSASHDGPIDLLITDVIMPEVGGRELAQIVRAQRPGTPVLYVSGYTDDELLRRGILEPGAQLLRKPFMPSDLAASARQLLRARRISGQVMAVG